MGAMPEIITKGKILSRIDELSKNATQLVSFLGDLKNSNRDFVTVLVDHGVAKEGAEENHLREYWLRAWWTNARTEQVARQGLITASEAAFNAGSGGKPLPLDCYWVCREDKNVQVSASWNDRQVVFIIYTPFPPDKGVATTEENISIVKVDATGSVVVLREKTGPPPA